MIPSHRVVGRGRRLCYPAGAAVLSLLQLIEYKSIEGFNNSEKMLLSEFLGIQMNDGEDELEDVRRYAQAAYNTDYQIKIFCKEGKIIIFNLFPSTISLIK